MTDESTQYMIYLYPILGNSSTTCHIFGPDSLATCQAALNKVAPRWGNMILPVEPLSALPVEALSVDKVSGITNELNEAQEKRTKAAEELGGFT